MAKLIVQHEVDPGIAITLTEAQGWQGSCTECGHTVHAWTERKAISRAMGHVNRHESGL